MHKITNLWKFELNWSSKLRDNYERKRTPLSHEVVFFQLLDFGTSNSKLEVSKSNSWKISSFSKSTSLQREPFLTMFYTINHSLLLVTKWGFMLIIILSNYQWETFWDDRGQQTYRVNPLFSELCACSELRKQWNFTRYVCCHLALESLL